MPAENEVPQPYAVPLSLLVCPAAAVAMVGGARHWESATGLSHWTWLAGDGAAALASRGGAGEIAAALTATVVPFAAVVLGYRAAETALNRRDAASAAGSGRT